MKRLTKSELVGDEHIIASRTSEKNKKRYSILNNITIDRATYQFAEREVSPYFSMVLPENFHDLAPEYILLKYPNVNRPTIILSNAEGVINFAFEHMPVNAKKVETRLKTYKAVIKRLHPSYVFFSENIFKIESGQKIVCYDFRGIAIDDDIYCLNFYTDLPKGELFGWFSCPIDSQAKWEPLVRQMIRTIKPLSPNENGEVGQNA